MARPLEFDIDVALDAAMEQFWRDGFEASSIQKLLDVMGINRGSLYATFGDKETLFLRTLERYDQQLDQHIQKTLQGISDPLEAVESFLLHKHKASRSAAYGCYYVNCGAELAFSHPALVKRIAKKQQEIEKRLKVRLVEAKESGALAANADPGSLASFLMVVRSGLSMSSRQGQRKAKIQGILNTAMQAVID
jgi:TetR/AcrR family transcriptional repressor of nem operon